MNYAAMANLAREQANVSSTDYSDTRLLPFFNAVKDDFWAYLITAIRANYNWDTWKVNNTVANQSEYASPEAASDSEGNLKISGIGICYGGDTYEDGTLKYVPAREVNRQSLPEHWNYYINNQPASDPIYYLADRSYFIAPSFDSVVANGIELSGIKSIADYTTAATEADIKIPYYLHNDLVKGVLPYIHRAEGRKDEASFEEKNYEKARALAVKKFANRSVGPSFLKYPETITDPIID